MKSLKKTIVIVNNNLGMGGIQKSLVNLLNEISDKFDITLFLFKKSGALLHEVPDNVKITEAKGCLRLLGVSQAESRQMGGFYYFLRAILALSCKLFNNHLIIKVLVKTQLLKEKYDIAISYMQNSDSKLFFGGCNDFVINSTNANRKISFVHCDFSNYEGNNSHNRRAYNKFDKIALVSNSCKSSFETIMPHLTSKTVCVYNCCNYEKINKMADENPFIYGKGINLLTVARISEEKGLLRCIDIIKELNNSGCKLFWHIIGDGVQKTELLYKIKLNALDDYVIYHGETNNPYRYMKNASALFVPSYHEAAPMVFMEAKALGLPILSTDTCSAKEMITTTHSGIVCDNTNQSIYQLLLNVCKNPQLLKINAISADNHIAVKGFYNLVDEAYD
ncbi:MAG TPA: glycosyltransferase [Clostridiales bacterium]|nr:glycosyltransferase [Clostridiales bacterium]